MKKLLSALLAAAMLAAMVCLPAAAEGGDSFLLLDCESLDGWYGTTGPRTTLSLSEEKKQGEHGIRMDYFNLTNSNNPDQGGCATVEFAKPADLSNYTKIQFDLYIGHDMTGKKGEMQVNFISDRLQTDGFNVILDLSGKTVGWHTLSGDIPAEAVANSEADLNSVVMIRVVYTNKRELSEQYFILDNFQLTGAKSADKPVPEIVYYQEPQEPADSGFVVDCEKDARYNDMYSVDFSENTFATDGSTFYSPIEEDVQAKVWYGWDKYNIYWYLEVKDNEILPDSKDDFVEFWLDPDPSTQKSENFHENRNDADQGDTNFRYRVASGEIEDYLNHRTRHWSNEKNLQTKVTEDGYIVECRIPRVEGENSFRFNISVKTADREMEDGLTNPSYNIAVGAGWWLWYHTTTQVDFSEYDFMNPPTVKGTVTTQQDDITVDGVTVTLHEVVDGTVAEQALQTTTVAEGAYQFEDVVPGNYAVKIAGTDKYDAIEQKFRVTGKNVTVPAITLGEIKEPEPPVDDTVYGDVTGDGEIDSVDALAILQHNVGILLDEQYLKAADVYQDGSIDSTDALCVLQYIVGLEKELPIIPD